MLEARQQGKIRFIGISAHARHIALEAIDSGLYDTVQYPLSLISNEDDLHLAALCQQRNVGLIAMKALSGGLVKNIAVAYAFMRRYKNIVPIWGIEKMQELEEFLRLDAAPPQWSEAMDLAVDEERRQLSGNFCRGCGYCLPCPADIDLPLVARIGLAAQRMPPSIYASEEWQAKVRKVPDCIECGQCAQRCPYELVTYELIKEQAAKYWAAQTLCV